MLLSLRHFIDRLPKQENITEKLKENTQIEWIKAMNNVKNRAEEIIYNEIIYSFKFGVENKNLAPNFYTF